jgi:hypothetical protein
MYGDHDRVTRGLHPHGQATECHNPFLADVYTLHSQFSMCTQSPSPQNLSLSLSHTLSLRLSSLSATAGQSQKLQLSVYSAAAILRTCKHVQYHTLPHVHTAPSPRGASARKVHNPNYRVIQNLQLSLMASMRRSLLGMYAGSRVRGKGVS